MLSTNKKKPSAGTASNARQLTIGALVTTDFSGRITQHRIIGQAKGVSQTGLLFKVDPPVPKSSGPDTWIDSGWFTPENVGVQEELF